LTRTMDRYLTLTLEGDPYAMGWQHGRQVHELRPLIVQAMEARFTQIEQDGPDARFETLLRETRDLFEASVPPLLAMIRGQADALDVEFETLLRYALVSYLRDDLVLRRARGAEGCTTWAAAGSATADGQPMLVKNRDYLPEHLPLQVVVRATPEAGYRYLYVSSAGSPGVFCAGINQAGLAVADTHVYSADLGPGLPSYALMMQLLEAHDSVPSALDYLRATPRLGRNNLILADGQGRLAVFESGNRRYGLFESSDGVLVNTNHFVSAEMRPCFVEIDPPDARGRSFGRYEKAMAELEAAFGQVDVAFAQRLMASHDGSLASLCCHPEANSFASTISASILLPVQRQMLFCHGQPCQGYYDEFSL